jgi:hypothetical protein
MVILSQLRLLRGGVARFPWLSLQEAKCWPITPGLSMKKAAFKGHLITV